MSATRRSTVVLGVLVLALAGIGAEWQATDGSIGLGALIDLAAGWALAGAGLAAWVGAPGSRIGPLLVASAAGWFIGTVAAPATPFGRSDLGWVAGFLWQLHVGFLIQAIATWPSGRITRPTQTLMVVGGYLVALVPQLWTTSPAYVVLGVLLAGGVVLDQHWLAPARRPGYRPARDAGLLLAAALVGLPALARACYDLGWMLLGDAGTWYAIVVAAVGTILAGALVTRGRRGATADLAVELRRGSGTTVVSELEQLVRDATAADPGDDPRLHRAVTQANALVERNRGLQDELRAQVRELDASRRRLVEVADEERLDLVERLRHGAGARLETLAVTVRTFTGMGDAISAAPGDIGPRLVRAVALLDQVRADLDALADGLDPGGVAEQGLGLALQGLTSSSPVPVTLELPAEDRPPLTVATTLWFVASEGLANVARHARATAAGLRLRSVGPEWRLELEDDGVGGADPERGTGLRGLRERVEAIGGALAVDARPGGGTRLTATIPTVLMEGVPT